LLYGLLASLGDWQFLYIALTIILPIAVFMGQTAPYDRIHVKRPTASLMSKKVLTPLLGQIVLQGAFQVFFFFHVRTAPGYKAPNEDPDGRNIESYENSSVFLISCFQYIFIAIVFMVGPPYRKSMFGNYAFMATVAILTAFTTYLVFWPHEVVMRFFEMVTLPESFKWLIMGGGALYLLTALIGERWVFPFIATGIKGILKWRRRRYIAKYGGVMERKVYKAVLREMR